MCVLLSELFKLYKNLTLIFIICWLAGFLKPLISYHQKELNSNEWPHSPSKKKVSNGWEKNYIFWNWNRNWMVKRKHSLQFMGLVYIWHVEMNFREEKNSWRQLLIIYVSEDMLTKERPPRVYSEGVYIHWTSFKYKGQRHR